MANIPIVIVHIGDSYYLRDIVEVNASKNPVIFVGCENNAYLGQIPNVNHMHFRSLQDPYVDFMREHYVKIDKGYDCTDLEEVDKDFKNLNDSTIRFLWILRVFFVKKILEREKLDMVFHLDSDCVLLESTNTLAEAIGNRLAYTIENIHNNTHMVGSIHNSLLDLKFCNALLKMYEDIYVNKNKRHLLKDKIEGIASGKFPGNICDMNLYYLLWQQKLVELFDLTQPFVMDGELCVFDHNIYNPSGFSGAITYRMKPDHIGWMKVFTFERGNIYQESMNGQKVRLVSLHFNADAKKRVPWFRQQLHI